MKELKSLDNLLIKNINNNSNKIDFISSYEVEENIDILMREICDNKRLHHKILLECNNNIKCILDDIKRNDNIITSEKEEELLLNLDNFNKHNVIV
jgi:hypothetical protein